MGKVRDFIAHGWNLFTSEEEKVDQVQRFVSTGPSYGHRPDRRHSAYTNDKSIISAIYTRIALDVSSIELQHVKLDENDSFLQEMTTDLNNCLKVEANIDQAATAFKIDMAYTLFEQGAIAIVPVDTDLDPENPGSFAIKTLRVGTITNWFPEHVEVDLFNQKKGIRQRVRVPKKTTAIVQNPFYPVMNEQNGVLQRLIRKLNLLDAIDEQAGSGKLDIIIQLPYALKTESRREAAKIRRQDMEDQLAGSKYGVAYADSTEKITQLNRPAENNMLKQVEYLTDMLYAQLGLTKEVFDGTASEAIMLNYYNRTVEPVLTAIAEAMHRAFLTKTARTQKQAIKFYRNPFKLMTVTQAAELADKLTRNEVLTSNEFRAIIGYRPHDSERANELVNKNMPTAEPPIDGGELVPADEQGPPIIPNLAGSETKQITQS